MKGTSREIFLERVRDALGRRERSQPGPFTLDHNVIRRPFSSAEDELTGRIDLFSDRAREVGMSVAQCQQRQVSEFLSEWIGSEQLSTVLLSDDPLLDTQLRKQLTEQKVEIYDKNVDLDSLYERVDCGITVARAAVAATGSLVLSSSHHELRLASLVPPRHLVLVPVSRLIDDLLDLSGPGGVLESESGVLPSSVALVTGPSKTADIEGVLVTGVHGPGSVQIVLVEGS